MGATRDFTVLGQKIVVKEGPESELATFAMALVEEHVNEIKAKNPMLGPNQVSVLAVMEIAGQLVRDRKLIDQYREELNRKCIELKDEISRLSTLEKQFNREVV